MNQSNQKIRFACLIALIFIILDVAWGLNQVEDRLQKSFQVGLGGTLTLSSDLGSVEVQSSEGNTLTIDVLFKTNFWDERKLKDILKDFHIDFRQDGNSVFINAEYLKKRHFSRDLFDGHLHVMFIISLPSKYNLDLQTKGGSISIDKMEGKVCTNTSGGNLNFEMIQGDIIGQTSGGSVHLKECEGNANIKTSGGNIDIGKVNGEVSTNTSGGNIKVDEVFGTINAKTSGGSISALVSAQPKSNCRLITSGGNIRIRLDEMIRVDVDASTSGGGVHTDFPVTLHGELSKHHLQAKINGGGPLLFLETSGGNIYLEKNNRILSNTE